MKFKFKHLIATMSFVAFSFIASPTLAAPQVMTPPPPAIDAKAFLLLDATTGKILAEKSVDTKLPPASLTKLMTLFLVSKAVNQGNITPDDTVRISKKAWKMGGSKMFIREGDKVKVSDLIQGVVVDSGNDASVALAEFLAGSEDAFVALMNAQAKVLGMTNTHYTDATGLTMPDHYSTARDLGTLARTIITQFPEEYSWYSQKSFTYADIKQNNRNRLLWRYDNADGLKTGHTDAAGYCIVASAQRDGTRLIAVVLGTPSDSARAEETERLLTYGFRFFKTVKLFDAGQTVANARVYFGTKSTLNLGTAKTFAVTAPLSLAKNVHTETTLTNVLQAPIKKGDILGSVSAKIDSKTIASAPLVALTDDPAGGWWTSSTDYISLTWHNWFS